MIQHQEMKQTRPMELHDGVVSTTTKVWEMLVPSRDGDLDRVVNLAEHCPALLTSQYDYTTPLHLAMREGHDDDEDDRRQTTTHIQSHPRKFVAQKGRAIGGRFR